MHISELKNRLEKSQDFKRALRMKAYMKGQFEYFGLDAQSRRILAKPYISSFKKRDFQEVKNEILELWEYPQREYQYIAMDLFSKHEKKITRDGLSLIETLVTTKSWWDTVDWLASHAFGTYLKLYPSNRYQMIEDWMSTENMWKQRSCIIHQLFYKHSTDKDLLAALINETEGSKEFFINKASGWALRQYSRSNPIWVENYINENRNLLSNLTAKEGMKWIEKQR